MKTKYIFVLLFLFSINIFPKIECAEFYIVTLPNSYYEKDCSLNDSLCELGIPNLFTPNGDAINDTWIADLSQNYPQAEIYVCDNWGNLVFAAKNGFAEWDGKVNGKLVPVDSYLFIIRNNKKTLCDGSVTVWY